MVDGDDVLFLKRESCVGATEERDALPQQENMAIQVIGRLPIHLEEELRSWSTHIEVPLKT